MFKNSSAKYYQKKKQRKASITKACEKYQDLCDEEKNKKQEYGQEYKNLCDRVTN